MIGDKKQFGFSLVEMIIATAVFALAFVAISAIYVGISTSQNRAKEKAVILNETQIVFEQMARDIRGKLLAPEPSVCNCPGSNSSFICLKDLTNNRFYYKYDETNGAIEYYSGSASCALVEATNSWVTLTDASMEVTNLEFLDGTQTLENGNAGQGLTQINFSATNRGVTNIKRKVTIDLQTVASSRLYAPSN